MTYIGIDNGVSGSIAIIKDGDLELYVPTPVKKTLNYTKAKAFITRLDGIKFKEILENCLSKDKCLAVIERPMLMPGRWKASVSAIRCDESQRNIFEILKVPFRYIDSKEWQRDSKLGKGMLPSGLEKQELKIASCQVGKQLFPQAKIKKDADALLIAEFARRNNL